MQSNRASGDCVCVCVVIWIFCWALFSILLFCVRVLAIEIVFFQRRLFCELHGEDPQAVGWWHSLMASFVVGVPVSVCLPVSVSGVPPLVHWNFTWSTDSALRIGGWTAGLGANIVGSIEWRVRIQQRTDGGS